MPFAELEGARLYYEQHGNPDGDHVVFHHGAGGNALSWWRQLPVFGEVCLYDHAPVCPANVSVAVVRVMLDAESEERLNVVAATW